ncbi:hypothetical protein T03_17246 [Trichinella britovi]|uniref:Reverse transcriptase RNase H-like domain-containing protein n=1 Tax=Trichinella britovi TaxID=45882 RepID=A0A0V1C3S8_TRIBR|nr:hypothetical protein T03_17246 [Trichinella britovi]
MLGLVWALREFRSYLYGQLFLLRTDHSCLRWLTQSEGQWNTEQDACTATPTRYPGTALLSVDGWLPNPELKTWRRALKTSCWPPSRQTQRSNYCGNGWLARAGRWNVTWSVAVTCTCVQRRSSIVSSGDIALDSRSKKGLSRRWCREPSETKSSSQCTTVSTEVTWLSGGRWHDSGADSTGTG